MDQLFYAYAMLNMFNGPTIVIIDVIANVIYGGMVDAVGGGVETWNAHLFFQSI